MSLLTEDLRRSLPHPGASPDTPLEQMVVHACFRDPDSDWRWYPVAFDGEDTFFGVVASSRFAFAGQFTLSELEALRCDDEGAVRLDPDFEPVPLGDLVRRKPKLAQVFAKSGLGLVDLDS